MDINKNLNIENDKDTINNKEEMPASKLELETLFTLQKGLTVQLEVINKRIEEITTKTETEVYTCDLYKLTFTDEEKYKTHICSREYGKKAGHSDRKCKLCNRRFYNDNDYSEHFKDGRCEGSRTYNGILFSNMQRKCLYMKTQPKEESVMGKGVAEKDEPINKKKKDEPINKKKKVKLIIKPKPLVKSTPKPLESILVNKNPTPVSTNYKKDKTNHVELFNKPKVKPVKLTKEQKNERGKYKLKPLPESKDFITAHWYMSLYEAHKSEPFTDGEGFYTKTSSKTGFKFDRHSSFRKEIIAIATEIQRFEFDKNDPEENYLKKMEHNIIYWSDGSKACSICNEGNNYYNLEWVKYNEDGIEIEDTEVKVI